MLLSRFMLAAATAWAFVSAAQAGAPATIEVDGLAAVVGNTASEPDSAIILNSDVELLAYIALSGSGASTPKRTPLPTSLLRAVLNEIIGEHLIAREAERVRISVPGAEEIARERRRLEEAAGGAERLKALLRALSVAPQEIDQIVNRRALLTAFLSANLEGATVVTDSEIDRAYQRSDGVLPGQTPEADKEILRARLARAALDQSIARWVETLRARTPVRIFAAYAR